MSLRLRLIFVASASALLAACALEPVPYYGETVVVEPPPPRVEYLGYPPVPGYVWIGGYWGWGGYRYDWIPGRWAPPRPGYRWVEPRWERDGNHWRQHGGRWEDDRGHSRPPQRHETNDGPRPGMVPGRPEARPERNPPPRPEVRPEIRPDNRPDMRPEIRPDARPEGRPGRPEQIAPERGGRGWESGRDRVPQGQPRDMRPAQPVTAPSTTPAAGRDMPATGERGRNQSGWHRGGRGDRDR